MMDLHQAKSKFSSPIVCFRVRLLPSDLGPFEDGLCRLEGAT